MDRWDQVAIAMADCRKFHHNFFPTSSSSITNCEDGYEEHLEGEFLVVCDTQIPLLMYHPLIIYCRRFFPSRKCNMLGVCILAFRGKVEMPVLVLNIPSQMRLACIPRYAYVNSSVRWNRITTSRLFFAIHYLLARKGTNTLSPVLGTGM